MADPSKYPTRLAPYGLRIPPELKARLEASAKENGRTLHAEIIDALEFLYPALSPMEEIREKIDAAIKDRVRTGNMGEEEIEALRGIRNDLNYTLENWAEIAEQARKRLADDDIDIPF